MSETENDPNADFEEAKFGDELFDSKPSSYFTASAEFLGNMFATAKWYGYGKARPEGDDVSASERDRNNYIFPHADFTLKLGVNTKLGVVGGDLKVTTPAHMRIETKAQVLQSYTNETWFRWFAWEDEGAQVDGVPIKAEATATQQSTGLLNLAVQAAQFSVGGVNNDVDGIAVENPPAPGKAAAVPTQATYGAAAAATSAAASKEAQSAAGKKLGEVTQRLSDNVSRLKTAATSVPPLDDATQKAIKSDIAKDYIELFGATTAQKAAKDASDTADVAEAAAKTRLESAVDTLTGLPRAKDDGTFSPDDLIQYRTDQLDALKNGLPDPPSNIPGNPQFPAKKTDGLYDAGELRNFKAAQQTKFTDTIPAPPSNFAADPTFPAKTDGLYDTDALKSFKAAQQGKFTDPSDELTAFNDSMDALIQTNTDVTNDLTAFNNSMDNLIQKNGDITEQCTRTDKLVQDLEVANNDYIAKLEAKNTENAAYDVELQTKYTDVQKANAKAQNAARYNATELGKPNFDEVDLDLTFDSINQALAKIDVDDYIDKLQGDGFAKIDSLAELQKNTGQLLENAQSKLDDATTATTTAQRAAETAKNNLSAASNQTWPPSPPNLPNQNAGLFDTDQLTGYATSMSTKLKSGLPEPPSNIPANAQFPDKTADGLYNADQLTNFKNFWQNGFDDPDELTAFNREMDALIGANDTALKFDNDIRNLKSLNDTANTAEDNLQSATTTQGQWQGVVNSATAKNDAATAEFNAASTDILTLDSNASGALADYNQAQAQYIADMQNLESALNSTYIMPNLPTFNQFQTTPPWEGIGNAVEASNASMIVSTGASGMPEYTASAYEDFEGSDTYTQSGEHQT